jgi:hypothetical protein
MRRQLKRLQQLVDRVAEWQGIHPPGDAEADGQK